MNAVYDSELYHHGVKGQKWGVRHERQLDTSLARNSQTRRVASDHNRMSNKEFRQKYYVSKRTFAKRYDKSNGDTYNMGRRKAAKIGSNPVLYGMSKIGEGQIKAGKAIRSAVTGKPRERVYDESVKVRDQARTKKVATASMSSPETKRQISRGKQIALGLGLIAGGAALAYAGGSGRAASISKASSSLSSAVSAVKKRGY